MPLAPKGLEKSFISTRFNCWKEVYKVLNLRIHCIHVGDKYLGLNLRKMIIVRNYLTFGIDKRDN